MTHIVSYNLNIPRHNMCRKEGGELLKGSYLKRLRLAENLTQEEMASLVGMSYRSYRSKECGQRRVSLDEAKRISDVFDMKIEDIFFRK